MIEIQISTAIAGAMLLALPVMELALGEGLLPAIYEAIAFMAGALLIAAVVLLVRAARRTAARRTRGKPAACHPMR